MLNYINASGDKSWGIRKVVCEHDFPDGQKVVVSDDGFVGVLEPEKEAKSLLNTTLATALTWNIQG